MDAQNNMIGPIHEIAGSLTASPRGGLAAAFSARTPDRGVALAVLGAVGVTGFVAVGVGVAMLSWGYARRQGAEHSPIEDGDGHAPPQRLKPPE